MQTLEKKLIKKEELTQGQKDNLTYFGAANPNHTNVKPDVLTKIKYISKNLFSAPFNYLNKIINKGVKKLFFPYL